MNLNQELNMETLLYENFGGVQSLHDLTKEAIITGLQGFISISTEDAQEILDAMGKTKDSLAVFESNPEFERELIKESLDRMYSLMLNKLSKAVKQTKENK